jgi:hypothetical protein
MKCKAKLNFYLASLREIDNPPHMVFRMVLSLGAEVEFFTTKSRTVLYAFPLSKTAKNRALRI